MNHDSGCFQFFRQLQAAGIHCLFGNPGTSEQNFLNALSDSEFESFKYYLALHEGSAVAMGDSYARSLQRPAVVQLHSYAGLANGMGMMYYAKRGYTPMVIFAGEAGLKYDAMDGQMAADLVNMARPFVKCDANGPCAWRVVDPNSVVRLLRRAIKVANTSPKGPVFLTLPIDVLDQPCPEKILTDSALSSGVLPDEVILSKAAELLASAQRPLILIGDGIASSKAQEELVRLAEELAAPVWGVNNSEVNIPMSHPLFMGDTGHMFGSISLPITRSADVVLVCGTTLMPEVFPSIENIFHEDAKVIHFDLNTAEIGKNFPYTIGALADPKPTLARLAALINKLIDPQKKKTAVDLIEKARNEKEDRRNSLMEDDNSRYDAQPMHLPVFLKALSERITETGRNLVVFDEALTHSAEVTRYLRFDTPGSYFQTRVGMLGTGLPGAIGLKLARPNDLVIGFVGDGGSMQTIQALSTAARYKIGAKFIICNNRSYRILKYNLQRYWADQGEADTQCFPKEFELIPPYLDFVKLAEGQGVKGAKLDHSANIKDVLDLFLSDPDEPFLLDIVISGDL